MNTFKIFGASDDLIEIRGAVTDEFGANYNSPTRLMVGNTEVVVEYVNAGVWKIAAVDEGVSDIVSHYEMGKEEAAEYKDYSELLVVETQYDRVEILG